MIAAATTMNLAACLLLLFIPPDLHCVAMSAEDDELAHSQEAVGEVAIVPMLLVLPSTDPPLDARRRYRRSPCQLVVQQSSVYQTSS